MFQVIFLIGNKSDLEVSLFSAIQAPFQYNLCLLSKAFLHYVYSTYLKDIRLRSCLHTKLVYKGRMNYINMIAF